MKKFQFPVFALFCFISSLAFSTTKSVYKYKISSTKPKIEQNLKAGKPSSIVKKVAVKSVINKEKNKNIISTTNIKNVVKSNSNENLRSVKGADVGKQLSNNTTVLNPILQNTISNQDFYSTLPDVVDRILPTVVTISALKNSGSSDYYSESSSNNMESLGSGFIISGDGYIVTNNHVIDGAEKVNVKLKGSNTNFPADIVGIDEIMDIALLKVNLKYQLPHVDFNETNNCRIGDLVIVAGNPYDLGTSISTGIISALNRNLQITSFDNFIQTDASINKGNSGGPMFNKNGKVIGLTSAIYSPDGSSTGIGFAIPVSDLMPIVDELKKFGYVKRGWIGISTENTQKEIFDVLNSQIKRGVIITNVTVGSPAYKAGIMVSDIIHSYDGKKVKNVKELSTFVSSTQIGSVVKVGILRNNRLLLATLKVEENKENYKYDQDYEALLSKSVEVFDMLLVPINKESIKKFNIQGDNVGMYVLKTKKDGIADKKGIVPGDVIISINQNLAISKAVILNSVHNAKINKADYVFVIVGGSKNNLVFIPIKQIKSSNTQS